MARTIHVEGYDDLQKVLQDNQGQTIFVLFTGSKGADGKSWCPDCVKADPVIEECLELAPASSVFVFCGVGQRDFWKDQTNVFRRKLGVKCVPTLLKWGRGQKLEESECAEKGLVTMLFEED